MKRNVIVRKGHRKLFALLGLIVLLLLSVGLVAGYGKLRAKWLEQCVITDLDRQVAVTSGKMVKDDVLREAFGLKVGVNLEKVDFAARRTEILSRIPNIRSLTVRRHMPDRVSIAAEERVPVVRLAMRGQRADRISRAADTEGVVFLCRRGTGLLPIVREAGAVGTAAGRRLSPRTLAAIELVELCREPKFCDLGILEVDVSKPDFLVAKIGSDGVTTAKIAWAGMDERTPAAHANLVRQMTHLVTAMRSRIGDGALVWNATDTSIPGRVYADTKGNLK